MVMLRTVFFPTLAISSKAFKSMVSLKGDSVNQVGGILQLSGGSGVLLWLLSPRHLPDPREDTQQGM